MTPLLIIGIVCIFFAILAVVFALVATPPANRVGVNRSMAVIQAVTAAPTEMVDELDPPFTERVLIPLLGRFQAVGQRLTPADAGDRVREKLDLAGNPAGWTPERVAAGKVVGLILGLLLSIILAVAMNISFMIAVIFVIAAAVAGYMAPNLYLYQRAYDRTEELKAELPDAIDLLTISVEAGLGFDAALAQVARNTDGPLSDEFSRLLQEMQIGRGRSDALRSMAERTNLPELRSFISAMVQADTLGVSVGQVLRVQSAEIRVKRRQWAEEKAQQVPVKILIPLIFCILPCLFIAVLGPAGISIMENFAGNL